MPTIADEQLWQLFVRADEIGLRLELGSNGLTWESAPGYRHQEICLEVVNSVQPAKKPRGAPCGCYRNMDVAIRFPDGTVKRPDVAIFCERPQDEEGFVHRVPEAVIEVLSPGYEAKDLVAGPPHYLSQGVQDVLVLDRFSGTTHQFRKGQQSIHQSPKEFLLECGCRVVV